MITTILKTQKICLRGGGGGGRVKFASLLAGNLSLGKCRDTTRFWLGGQGLGWTLAHSLVIGVRTGVVWCWIVAAQRSHCHYGTFVLHCFSLSWVSLCSQEQLLNWHLFNTRPHWEGDPDPRPPSGGSNSKLLAPAACCGYLQKPGCLCLALLFSAAASGFFATL